MLLFCCRYPGEEGTWQRDGLEFICYLTSRQGPVRRVGSVPCTGGSEVWLRVGRLDAEQGVRERERIVRCKSLLLSCFFFLPEGVGTFESSHVVSSHGSLN